MPTKRPVETVNGWYVYIGRQLAPSGCEGSQRRGVCMIMTKLVSLPNRRHTQCPSLQPHSYAGTIQCHLWAIVFNEERINITVKFRIIINKASEDQRRQDCISRCASSSI